LVAIIKNEAPEPLFYDGKRVISTPSGVPAAKLFGVMHTFSNINGLVKLTVPGAAF
jgi:hypothetical protein